MVKQTTFIVIHALRVKPSSPIMTHDGNRHTFAMNKSYWKKLSLTFEPVHEISNNVVCATSNASDQPAHTRSLIRAFASRLSTI